MKQLTEQQAEQMATADKERLKQWVEYAAHDWVEANARDIAAVEMNRTDKTCFGLYPDGWRKAMKAAAKANAARSLTARFIAGKCRRIDGVLWLADLRLIEEIEKS